MRARLCDPVEGPKYLPTEITFRLAPQWFPWEDAAESSSTPAESRGGTVAPRGVRGAGRL